MFIFEHYDYIQFMHEYIEAGYTAKIAAQRNVSKYKTNAYYRPPEQKRYSIEREERGYLAPEANGTRIFFFFYFYFYFYCITDLYYLHWYYTVIT